MVKLRNKFFILLIMAGLVFAAIFAAHIPPFWDKFTLSALVMVSGIVGLRLSGKKNEQQDQTSAQSVEQVYRLIAGLNREVENVLDQSNPEMLPGQAGLLEDTFEHYLIEIERNREVLIERMGTAQATAVFSYYARAERGVNRGISAAIDGYSGEAVAGLKTARKFLDLTLKELQKYERK